MELIKCQKSEIWKISYFNSGPIRIYVKLGHTIQTYPTHFPYESTLDIQTYSQQVSSLAWDLIPAYKITSSH